MKMIVDDRLPLRPVAFAVLAALAERPRPGIDILDHVNATTPGRPLLGPGTLYRVMRELRQIGFIGRTEAPATPGGRGEIDERQAHHELTRLGRTVLAAESARLRRTLALARRVHQRVRRP